MSAPPAGVSGVTAPTTAPVAAPIPAPLTVRSVVSVPQALSSSGVPTASRARHVLETIDRLQFVIGLFATREQGPGSPGPKKVPGRHSPWPEKKSPARGGARIREDFL